MLAAPFRAAMSMRIPAQARASSAASWWLTSGTPASSAAYGRELDTSE
jgi:hypothetical protein